METPEVLNLEHFLIETYERGASDLVLSVGNPPAVRIDGVLSAAEGEVLTADKIEQMMKLLLTPEQVKQAQENQGGTFGVTYRGDARFRVHVYWQEGSASMSIRFIPKAVPQLASLGFSEKTISTTKAARGLIIIGGREGHGKTTTWASMIDAINAERNEHMVLLQKPTEHLITDKLSVVDQREVGTDVASFEQGVKDSAREAVTLLAMDGAPSSAWTTAFKRAVAGQTVLLTVEQLSVVDVINHFVTSVDSEHRATVLQDLSRVLSLMVIQALVPRASGGLELVHEILVGTHAVQQMISAGELDQVQNTLETSRESGMIGFDQHLALLTRDGRITPDEAAKYVVSKESFKALQAHGTI